MPCLTVCRAIASRAKRERERKRERVYTQPGARLRGAKFAREVLRSQQAIVTISLTSWPTPMSVAGISL